MTCQFCGLFALSETEMAWHWYVCHCDRGDWCPCGARPAKGIPEHAIQRWLTGHIVGSGGFEAHAADIMLGAAEEVSVPIT